MKVFQFTHSDLDGAGCAVLADIVYRNCLQTTFVDHYNIDDEIRKFLDVTLKAESAPDVQVVLLVSDITPSAEVCVLIDQAYARGGLAVGCYDHHKDKARLLDKYAWGSYRPDCCGTRLLYDVFMADEHSAAKLRSQADVALFVRAVNAYDMWELEDSERDRGETLNRLLWFLGIKTFVYEFSQQVTRDQSPDFGYINSRLHAQEEDRIAEALRRPLLKEYDPTGHLFGVLVATANASQLGHRLLADNPALQYVAVVNPVWNVVELRSRKGEVEVGGIARLISSKGGGHQAAAGFPFDLECAKQIAEVLRNRHGKS